MSPEGGPGQDLFPNGFLPLPHPNHPEGGMVFPKFHIDEIKKQEDRDLTRFDLDFDMPTFPAGFPPPIFLTTRPDLGDVSQGKVVTLENYYELFNGILNPKQLEGLRLLLTPFPQQQFNATEDRDVPKASRGVACFDCHVNGHTNGATHLAGDIRPQEFRHRIDTPSLRGVNIQRLFGSQRALKTVEDFTEFEQRAAYFDGDPVIATKKGVNFSNVAARSISWPSSRSCSTSRRRRSSTSAASSIREGERSRSCGARSSSSARPSARRCHPAPYYTDNSDARPSGGAFYKPQMINGRMAPGWTDQNLPAARHQGLAAVPARRPAADAGGHVEFFNLVLEPKLSARRRGTWWRSCVFVTQPRLLRHVLKGRSGIASPSNRRYGCTKLPWGNENNHGSNDRNGTGCRPC